MNKFYLLLSSFLITNLIISQVSFTIVEPSSIAGGYEFTSNGDAPNWGLADLNNPNDAVVDTVVIAEDGLQGLNAQGIPLSNEACDPLINDLTGKIALVYRYDGSSSNVCWVGTKVLNAENAGAVGVIIVNREETVNSHSGTVDGPSTSIPFAFISKTDGAIIREKIDAGEDVIAFIGNKFRLYDNDAGIKKDTTLVSTKSSILQLTAQDSSEFGFDLGTTIFNYGKNDLNNVTLNVSVNGPHGSWTRIVGPYGILSGESIDIVTGGSNHLDAFSLNTYPIGVYTLTYKVDLGLTDESSFDNTIISKFTVSDNIVSYAEVDSITNLPIVKMYSRAGNSSFKSCMVYDNPNGSRVGIAGMYLSATMVWNTTAPLEDELVDVYVYEWKDNFTDLLDQNFGFSELNDIAFGNYTFGPDDDTKMVYVSLEEPVVFKDNQRYLVCAETYNNEIWLGYNNRIDYSRNIARYLQPLVPLNDNTNYYYIGFSEDMAPAIAIKTFESSALSINKNLDYQINVYPNPAINSINVNAINSDIYKIEIFDITGRIISTELSKNEIHQINISSFETGQYLLKATNNQGESTYKNIIKN